jgi:hypothetical protein
VSGLLPGSRLQTTSTFHLVDDADDPFALLVCLSPSNNCFKNGMLPIILPQAQCQLIFDDASAKNEIEVDLRRNVIVRPNGETIPFQVDAFRRGCLLEGLDDIG